MESILSNVKRAVVYKSLEARRLAYLMWSEKLHLTSEKANRKTPTEADANFGKSCVLTIQHPSTSVVTQELFSFLAAELSSLFDISNAKLV